MLRKVYNSAVPQLKGKKVRDLCIGIELLAVELDGGEIGVAYVLKNEIRLWVCFSTGTREIKRYGCRGTVITDAAK
ncbi:MAG: enolase N-terminal-like fold-containing protein [Syntrophaceticus sp.]